MIFRITRWQPGVPGGKSVLVLPERPEPRHNRVFQDNPTYDAVTLIAWEPNMRTIEQQPAYD